MLIYISWWFLRSSRISWLCLKKWSLVRSPHVSFRFRCFIKWIVAHLMHYNQTFIFCRRLLSMNEIRWLGIDFYTNHDPFFKNKKDIQWGCGYVILQRHLHKTYKISMKDLKMDILSARNEKFEWFPMHMGV